jgi:hypothetical protein
MHSKAEDYVTPSSRSDDHQVSRSVRGHPCCLGWADLAEGRLCLDHLPAMADRRLSSPARARIPQMKVLILVPFAAAIISSIVWYEAAERNLTGAQKATFGVTALVAWILVFVVGSIVT